VLKLFIVPLMSVFVWNLVSISPDGEVSNRERYYKEKTKCISVANIIAQNYRSSEDRDISRTTLECWKVAWAPGIETN